MDTEAIVSGLRVPRSVRVPRCPRCQKTKDLSAFGTTVVKGKPRRQPYCHDCMASYVRERYASNAEYRAQIAERDGKRSDCPKYIARWQLRGAVKAGRVAKGPCEIGEGCRGVIQAHHDDYSKPLEVRWLCKLHHAQADREKRLREDAA
jgi:hypothetical protein